MQLLLQLAVASRACARAVKPFLKSVRERAREPGLFLQIGFLFHFVGNFRYLFLVSHSVGIVVYIYIYGIAVLLRFSILIQVDRHCNAVSW